ncbi:PH domain-containing protein [Candidatus Nanosalina sp. VS9-1]|uniref:PH domain-containing protein n=1 Tax=Candidatus Nanosalina sp. VS9-1 TaxID=3388566 RepID=UPI0039DFDE13
MRKPEKKILPVWIGTFILVSAVVSGLAAAVTWYFRSYPPADVFTGVFSFLIVLSIILGYVRYRAWRFTLRDDHMYLERGVFTRVKTMVPYVRIQHVDTQKSPVDRLLGLSKVVVYTAGSRGADVTIPGLLPEDARDMQEKLRDLAIESEDRDGV